MTISKASVDRAKDIKIIEMIRGRICSVMMKIKRTNNQKDIETLNYKLQCYRDAIASIQGTKKEPPAPEIKTPDFSFMNFNPRN